MINKISLLEKNLDRVHDWVKSADQKVSIFLAFQGVVITLLFTCTFNWITFNFNTFSFIVLILLITSLVFISFSFYKSVSAIIPRINKSKKDLSLIYFGDIAKQKLNDFHKQIIKIDDQDYSEELIKQIHISSKIGVKKYSDFKDSIIFFVIGILLLAVIFINFKFLHAF